MTAMSNPGLDRLRVVRRGMLALISVAWGITAPVVISGSSATIETVTQVTGSGRIRGSLRTYDGKQLPAAMVFVSMSGWRAPRMTKTNAEGSFVFSDLPAGLYVVQGCTEEFGPSTPVDVELKPGMDVTQNLAIGDDFVKTAEPSCRVDSAAASRPDRYTGKAMSFDLRGDVRDFFRSVASISGLEVVVDASIDRAAAIHLKNIPWDLALDLVVKTSGLGSRLDGGVVRIAPANPALGQDRELMGTVTAKGKIIQVSLQNPRTLLQMNAPTGDGTMQIWRVEWESADYLNDIGIRPNTLSPGDDVIVTGNPTGRNQIQLISLRRPSDGFSWGRASEVRSLSPDAEMYVGLTSQTQ